MPPLSRSTRLNAALGGFRRQVRKRRVQSACVADGRVGTKDHQHAVLGEVGFDGLCEDHDGVDTTRRARFHFVSSSQCCGGMEIP